jgi:type II secretory pathway component GspD/PulD (secretin)
MTTSRPVFAAPKPVASNFAASNCAASMFFASMLMLTGGLAQAAFAQSSLQSRPYLQASSAAPRTGGVPLDRLIETVAKKSGRKFILDPRAPLNVQLFGEDASAVTYEQLLSILEVYGFVAVESGGLVRIVPDAFARYEATPLISDKDKHPDAQIVSVLVHLRSVSAAQLVPVLRPLVPPYGDLSAMPCVNTLLIVDRFANVRRIEAIIHGLDVGPPVVPRSCEPDH